MWAIGLAEYLHEAGALLYVTDIVQASVDRAVRELGCHRSHG